MCTQLNHSHRILTPQDIIIRSGIFEPSVDNLSTLTFSNEFSVFEISISLDSSVTDEYQVNIANMYSASHSFAWGAYISKTDGSGMISLTNLNDDFYYCYPNMDVYGWGSNAITLSSQSLP